jgi:hypothetical protein
MSTKCRWCGKTVESMPYNKKFDAMKDDTVGVCYQHWTGTISEFSNNRSVSSISSGIGLLRWYARQLHGDTEPNLENEERIQTHSERIATDMPSLVRTCATNKSTQCRQDALDTIARHGVA